MKPHRILKDFKGTQNGLGDGEQFKAGTTVPLSDWLAAVAVKGGLAVAVDEPKKPKEEPTAEDRDTKVAGPEENKVDAPEEPKKKKGK